MDSRIQSIRVDVEGISGIPLSEIALLLTSAPEIAAQQNGRYHLWGTVRNPFLVYYF